MPKVAELYDMEKVRRLTSAIDASQAPEEVKEFLRAAAMRHCVFNYSKIADYYAHADYETKMLMESSALVIIDFGKAIEEGFVKLSDEIREQYLKDYGK